MVQPIYGSPVYYFAIFAYTEEWDKDSRFVLRNFRLCCIIKKNYSCVTFIFVHHVYSVYSDYLSGVTNVEGILSIFRILITRLIVYEELIFVFIQI